MSTINLDNKTILVTGAAGFIGSNLVKRIYQEAPSATVIGIDNMNAYYDVALKEFRLNELANGESNSSVGIQMNAHWFFHSTKDLCFTFVNPVFEGVKSGYGKDVFYVANDASIIATKEKLKDLSALEELVMVGYPIGLSDTRNNYPIFRKGYTSAHPAVDFNDDGIGLVDMACFPGSSGSPIYILNEGGYRDKHGNAYFGPSRVILLGVLFAGPQYDARGDIVVKTIPTSKQVVGLSNGAISMHRPFRPCMRSTKSVVDVLCFTQQISNRSRCL